MTKRKQYLSVSQRGDGTWEFTVQKAGGKIKTFSSFSTAKVAALLRDEYILRHRLDQQRNFMVKRMARIRNEAYEQTFGRQGNSPQAHPPWVDRKA